MMLLTVTLCYSYCTLSGLNVTEEVSYTLKRFVAENQEIIELVEGDPKELRRTSTVYRILASTEQKLRHCFILSKPRVLGTEISVSGN